MRGEVAGRIISASRSKGKVISMGWVSIGLGFNGSGFNGLAFNGIGFLFYFIG